MNRFNTTIEEELQYLWNWLDELTCKLQVARPRYGLEIERDAVVTRIEYLEQFDDRQSGGPYEG